MRSHSLNNLLHAALLLTGMAGLLLAVGWIIGGPAGMFWLLVLGGASLLLTPRISPQLILRMYSARLLHPREAPALHDMLVALARRSHLQDPPALYYVPSSMMNAFSVGQRGDAAVALTDGLLRGLPPRELMAVLAHELAHVTHNDMWIMGLADGVSRMVRVFSLAGQVLLLVNLPLIVSTGRGMPWLPILLLVFAPTLSALLQLALSRNREFDADVEAARITGDPAGLASALQKLEIHQERSWQNLFLPGRRNRQPSLLRTHPASEARIARLREMQPETQPLDAEAFFRRGPPVPAWASRLMPRPRLRWHGLWF